MDDAGADTAAFHPFRPTAATVRRTPREGPFAPTYEVPADVHDDLRALERADQDLRRYRVDDVTARRLLEEALTRNAYGTASIEGNPLTLSDVESLLTRGPTPDNVVRPEEREILNYATFVRDLPTTPPPRDAGGVRELHARLFARVLEDAGAFKQRLNFIGKRPEYEVVFVPAPPERVVPELDAALAWLHDADEHPVVRAAVFFHEFQSIHPFRDGNGRLGRAITTALLHHAGYAGVRYALVDYQFNADRDAYYDTLRRVDRSGDATPWLTYMVRVLRVGFEDALRAFLFRDGLPEHLNPRQVRVAEWFGRLARDRPRTRVKFADVHAAFPTVAVRTLKRDLATLRDGRVLDAQGTGKGTTYRLQGETS